MESKQTDRFKKPSLGRAANSDPLITQNTFPFSLLACIAFKIVLFVVGQFLFIWGKPHLTFYRSFIFSFGTKKEKKRHQRLI